MVCAQQSLLAESDGPAVLSENPKGPGPFLIVCDHASNRIPASLGTLGLGHDVLVSHAAWDPGAYGVASKLARLLDAPLVAAAFSRLVYDVNRPPESAEAIRTVSEIYDVPGNLGLTGDQRASRARAVYDPYHAHIAELIEARIARGETTALVAIHSFTPVYHGQKRDVQLGILHDSDPRLADALLECAPRFTALAIARNRPYGPEDGVTHTLAKQAIPRGLLNAMIEIRNDLIASEGEQARIAEALAAMLRCALETAANIEAGTDRPGAADAPSN